MDAHRVRNWTEERVECTHMSHSTWKPNTGLRRFAAPILSIAVALAATAPATADVVINSFLAACGAPTPATPTSSGSFIGATQGLASTDCGALAEFTQGPGFAGARSTANMFTFTSDSGALNAQAGATLVAELVVAEFDPVPNLGSLRFTPVVLFSSRVGAGASNSLAAASISYGFSFGGNSVSGSKNQSADGVFNTVTPVVQTGPFGVVSLPPLTMESGNAFSISGSAQSSAVVSKFFATAVPANALAEAEFSTAILWLGGIVQLLDGSGQPMATPENFVFRLIGQTTGFNYANAALQPVPEPSMPWLLSFGSFGIGGLWLIRRRPAHRSACPSALRRAATTARLAGAKPGMP